MFRLIAILLLLLFTVGNSLARSHGTAAHQEGIGRAHFHVAVGHSHGHRDHDSDRHSHHSSHDADRQQEPSSDSTPMIPLEHDSDTVYVVVADCHYKASPQSSLDLDSRALVGTVEPSLVDLRPQVWRSVNQRSTSTELPLYLLRAALRL